MASKLLGNASENWRIMREWSDWNVSCLIYLHAGGETFTHCITTHPLIITPLITSCCIGGDGLMLLFPLHFFWNPKYNQDTPEVANASKNCSASAFQGFLLCDSEAALLSGGVWMADSQSSWGRYWFAEGKRDKSITERNSVERMNIPWKACVNV